MKSPEQMGGSSEKPESSKSYDEIGWEKLKQQGHVARALSEGKKMGVPQEELDRFAREVIAHGIKHENYDFVYRFMKNMGIGTEEKVTDIGEKAYKHLSKIGEFGLAMGIAEDVYGKDSEEWKRAEEENKRAIEAGELTLSISTNATFPDLFKAIDALEEKEGAGELHFWEELEDNFEPEVVDEILAFQNAPAGKERKEIKILDFFKKRGYSRKDVLAYLPIKFKPQRKKK